jgi:hypothetical protein
MVAALSVTAGWTMDAVKHRFLSVFNEWLDKEGVVEGLKSVVLWIMKTPLIWPGVMLCGILAHTYWRSSHPSEKEDHSIDQNMKQSEPQPEKSIVVGTRLRLCSPSNLEKKLCPIWIPAMDEHVGQEFVVESQSSNGLMRLRGFKYDVNVAWVEPAGEATYVRHN